MGCIKKNCCACFSLRTGSLIIGYFHLFGGFLLFATTTVQLITYIGYWRRDSYIWQETVQVFFVGTNVALIVISSLFTIGLLYGIHKRQARFIRPYLIFNVVFLVFHIVEFALLFTYTYYFTDFLINLVAISLTAYFLMVIRSYLVELRKEVLPTTSTVVVGQPEQTATAPKFYPAPEGYAEQNFYPQTISQVSSQSDVKLPIDPPPYQSA